MEQSRDTSVRADKSHPNHIWLSCCLDECLIVLATRTLRYITGISKTLLPFFKIVIPTITTSSRLLVRHLKKFQSPRPTFCSLLRCCYSLLELWSQSFVLKASWVFFPSEQDSSSVSPRRIANPPEERNSLGHPLFAKESRIFLLRLLKSWVLDSFFGRGEGGGSNCIAVPLPPILASAFAHCPAKKSREERSS